MQQPTTAQSRGSYAQRKFLPLRVIVHRYQAGWCANMCDITGGDTAEIHGLASNPVDSVKVDELALYTGKRIPEWARCYPIPTQKPCAHPSGPSPQLLGPCVPLGLPPPWRPTGLLCRRAHRGPQPHLAAHSQQFGCWTPQGHHKLCPAEGSKLGRCLTERHYSRGLGCPGVQLHRPPST